MAWVVSISLRNRIVVSALAVLLIAAGISASSNAQIDVFPEFAPPRVEVQTEAPGLTTDEVEALITVPIENALSGVAGLTDLRSKSVPGLSSVVMQFETGADVLRARQLVQERIAIVALQLPQLGRPPIILPPLSSTSRILKIGVRSDIVSMSALSTLVRWKIRPRLMAVPGVANVAVWGQRNEQVVVEVDPARLQVMGLAVADVERAARDAVTPAAGGFIETPNQRLAVRHDAAVQDAEQLAGAPVGFVGGTPLHLGDVANVRDGHPPLIGDGVIDQGLGLLLIVEKQLDANTFSITTGVEQALEELKPGLEGIHIDSTIFRPATFIEQSLGNLRTSILLGCVLVIAVLLLFLYDLRTAFISVLVIPLSLLAAMVVLTATGQSINTMTLAGLIIALGEVVDDAIIDVENVDRRLFLARTEGGPSPFEVVLAASIEVRAAVVYATVILIAVLIPVFMMEGLTGAFFRPLAMAYAAAIVSSLLVALTVTPALCLMLLGKSGKKRASPFAAFLKRRYETLLAKLLHRPRMAAWATVLAPVLALASASQLGESFLPDFRERDFLMHWVMAPGTSLPAMTETTLRASNELRAVPGVRNFGAHLGRAEVADEVVGVNFTELWISIAPDADYDETVAKVQHVVDGYPGLYRDVLTYLRERIKEVLTGASTALVVRIYGDDLEALRDQAQEVATALRGIEGVDHPKVEQQVLVPQIEVQVRVADAARLGLSPAAVRRVAEVVLQGTKVGELYDEQRVIDVVVRGSPELHHSVTALRELVVRTPEGAGVPLRAVADVRLVSGPNIIKRDANSRRIDVGFEVKGRSLGDVATEVEAMLNKRSMPRGSHARLLGEYAERQKARGRILGYSLLALVAVLLALLTCFGRVRPAALVAVTLPFAFLGGVVAAFIDGGVLSLGSMVGFITVLGIAARNGIMLVSHFEHVEHHDGVPFGETLVLQGAVERLSPILMTALTTSLALVPIIVAGDIPGHEIERPLAVVVLGGILSSLLLNLFVVPVLYLRWGKSAPKEPTS